MAIQKDPGLGGDSTSGSAAGVAAIALSYDGRKSNKPLHPSMRPIGGINSTPTTIRVGRIYNIDPNAATFATGVSKYAFSFMYNPNQISLDTSINWDINYDPRSSFATLPNAQTLTFELFLNRINDVRDPDPHFTVPTGTLHDLEYLYRTINGDPTTQNGITSSDFGFLVPTQVQVFFGSKFSFVGYITEIAINHAMFQHDMIPVYTTVNISMSRALTPVSGGAVDGTGTGGNSNQNSNVSGLGLQQGGFGSTPNFVSKP